MVILKNLTIRLRLSMGKIRDTFMTLIIGGIIMDIIVDEIKPNRLNQKWYRLPYIGPTYSHKN